MLAPFPAFRPPSLTGRTGRPSGVKSADLYDSDSGGGRDTDGGEKSGQSDIALLALGSAFPPTQALWDLLRLADRHFHAAKRAELPFCGDREATLCTFSPHSYPPLRGRRYQPQLASDKSWQSTCYPTSRWVTSADTARKGKQPARAWLRMLFLSGMYYHIAVLATSSRGVSSGITRRRGRVHGPPDNLGV